GSRGGCPGCARSAPGRECSTTAWTSTTRSRGCRCRCAPARRSRGRGWGSGSPTWTESRRVGGELPVVVERRLGLALVDVGVAVPLVEPPGVVVGGVDVDLQQLPAALADHSLGRLEEDAAQPAVAVLRGDVELVEVA